MINKTTFYNLISAVLLLTLLAQEAQTSQKDIPGGEKFLTTLASFISINLARHDTDHVLFHGCIDWHSSVHGHWAVLRISRVLKEKAPLGEAVQQNLNSKQLAAEHKFLMANTSFEMPYGRAWFLRLALESEAWNSRFHGQDSEVLTAMAQDVAASLLHYLEQSKPHPRIREYANASWAAVQLFEYYTRHGTKAEIQRIKKIIRIRLLEYPNPDGFSVDRVRPDFFSVFGNLAYLAAKSQDQVYLRQFLQKHPIAEAELVPVEIMENRAHHLGINWSRAWAFRALEQKVDDTQQKERFHRAFLDHVDEGMRLHDRMGKDYWQYGHWVPQFAVYAITEGM